MASKDLCRKHGFSEASYYKGHAKYGGTNVAEAKSVLLRLCMRSSLEKLASDQNRSYSR